jgi:DNA-directed RNA polymerase subunit L
MLSSKYTKRLNIFLLLNDENSINLINSMLKEFCKENACVYKIHPSSVIKRLFYIECSSTLTPLDKLYKNIENIVLKSASNIISWYKIESVEIK